MRFLSVRSTPAVAILAAALVVASAGAAPQSKKKGGAETFNGKARVQTGTAG